MPKRDLYSSAYEHDACGVGMLADLNGNKTHQIPHEFILLQGIPVPERSKYGTGLVFLPKDEKKGARYLDIIREEAAREGLALSHVRRFR